MSDQLPAAPWRFRDLGGNVALFADHGRRRVIIAAGRNAQLVTCDESGRLTPLTVDHPVAQAIEQVPALIAFVDEFIDWWEQAGSHYYAGTDEGLEGFYTDACALRDALRAGVLARSQS